MRQKAKQKLAITYEHVWYTPGALSSSAFQRACLALTLRLYLLYFHKNNYALISCSQRALHACCVCVCVCMYVCVMRAY